MHFLFVLNVTFCSFCTMWDILFFKFYTLKKICIFKKIILLLLLGNFCCDKTDRVPIQIYRSLVILTDLHTGLETKGLLPFMVRKRGIVVRGRVPGLIWRHLYFFTGRFRRFVQNVFWQLRCFSVAWADFF